MPAWNLEGRVFGLVADGLFPKGDGKYRGRVRRWGNSAVECTARG